MKLKYVKLFEELRNDTYHKAADKLDDMGHSGRANKLRLHSLYQSIKKYSKYGTYQLEIETENGVIEGDFHLVVEWDYRSWLDSSENFAFFIGIIPSTEELYKQCESMMEEPFFDNGFYWGMTFILDYEIVNELIQFKSFSKYDFDDSLTGKVDFINRTSIRKFMNLLINLLSDENMSYQMDNNYNNLHDAFTSIVLVNGNYGSDYGLEIADVVNYLKKVSVNKLYKSK